VEVLKWMAEKDAEAADADNRPNINQFFFIFQSDKLR
jgi:hypothetical protein